MGDGKMGEIVYREYDREALDHQYNCRAWAPDFEDQMVRWEALSNEAFERYAHRRDLAYGDAPGERLDLFLPAPPGGGETSRGPHPLMIFIHGGYWRSMDKAVHAFPAHGFVPEGIALASINYTLAPAVDMDEIVRECRAAVAWCWRNAADLGLDPASIHVTGHSAGGHLTAMMMATDWPAFGADLPADTVRTGCPISGLYDLEPISLTYLNEDVRLTDALIPHNSPVNLVPRGPSAMTICAGGLESPEFHRQQALLVERWAPHIADIEAVDMPGRHHFDVVTALAEPDGPLCRAVRRRIGHIGG